MDYIEDTGKYRRGNMEKPGAREGQESTGDIGYKRGQDNCMMTSFVHS